MAPATPIANPHDLVSVDVPGQPAMLSALVGLFYFIFGSVQLLSFKSWNPDNRIEDVLGGVFLTVGGVLILWMALARYRIVVSSKEFRVEKTALGLSTTRRYALNEIKNLRLEEERAFTYLPGVAVDHNGKRKFIGRELSEFLPPKLLDPIYEHFPQLAPGK